MNARRFAFAALAFVAAILACWSAQDPADALSSTKAYKEVSVTIVVTPSPTPLVWTPRRDDPPTAQIASSPALAWDVPPGFGAPIVVAQAQPQAQRSVPVQFLAKADPNYQYLHIVPGSQGMLLYAPYGTSTFTCVYQVYASYPSSWQVTDWAYGTASQGGTSTFPMLNYPATSDLAWLAEGVTSSYTNFYNAGTPGQLAFKSTGGTMQVCFDLQLTVPASQPAGTYTATAQYNLIVTL